MGLDTSHDAWHGAYSAFNRWRDDVARAAGYTFAKVERTVHYSQPEMIMIDWGHIEEKNFYGEWDQIPHGALGPDPLLLLIAHSDCEGMLTPEHCGLLADRLEGLLDVIPADQDGGGHVGNVRATTARFIAGCRLAAANNEELDFH